MKVNVQREKEIDHLVEEYFRYDPETGIVYHKIKRQGVFKYIAGSLENNGYLVTQLRDKKIKLHRLVWRLYYGKWPEKTLDHINGIKSDNRICNLREISKRENDQNKSYHRNGKLVGAVWNNTIKKYKPVIQHNYKTYILGFFDDPIEAHNQYIKACKALEQREFNSAKELREYIKNMK